MRSTLKLQQAARPSSNGTTCSRNGLIRDGGRCDYGIDDDDGSGENNDAKTAKTMTTPSRTTQPQTWLSRAAG